MPFEPGDVWTICDLSGKKVRMSETRKTWDGLRVWKEFWYPRNPQDFLRAIPERMAVKDARPRPADVWASTTFCLVSSGGQFWTFTLGDAGTLTGSNVHTGSAQQFLELGNYHLYVTDAGTLTVEASTFPVPTCYTMYSTPGNLPYTFSVVAGVLVITAA